MGERRRHAVTITTLIPSEAESIPLEKQFRRKTITKVSVIEHEGPYGPDSRRCRQPRSFDCGRFGDNEDRLMTLTPAHQLSRATCHGV